MFHRVRRRPRRKPYRRSPPRFCHPKCLSHSEGSSSTDSQISLRSLGTGWHSRQLLRKVALTYLGLPLQGLSIAYQEHHIRFLSFISYLCKSECRLVEDSRQEVTLRYSQFPLPIKTVFFRNDPLGFCATFRLSGTSDF